MPDVKEHGFLFKAEMILAILEGRKTQTRRVVTAHNSLIDGDGTGIRDHWKHLQWDRAWVDQGPSPAGNTGPYWKVPCNYLGDAEDLEVIHRVYPRVFVGDSIYAKETWRAVMEAYRTYVEYRAGGPSMKVDADDCADLKKLSLRFPYARKDRHSDAWKSPLHLPRWAARLVLPVVRVGAERVGDISEGDAKAEGAPLESVTTGACMVSLYSYGFQTLWDSINGKKPGRSFGDSPPVWVYEWEHHEGSGHE